MNRENVRIKQDLNSASAAFSLEYEMFRYYYVYVFRSKDGPRHEGRPDGQAG